MSYSFNEPEDNGGVAPEPLRNPYALTERERAIAEAEDREALERIKAKREREGK